MYRAKELGRNNYQFFTDDLNVQHIKRATIENALHQAIENDQLFMVYQPKYLLNTNGISGLEALLRWQHPTLGFIPPDEFIKISEENGMILSIGDWVIREVCKQITAWKHLYSFSLPVAINLSPVQLRDKQFMANLNDILHEYQIAAAEIEFELTETAVMSSTADIELNLNKLHEYGVKVSIDDFGTGYSSLARLKSLPIYALKIDRSFILELMSDENDQAIVSTIISLAKSLGIEVIAEGIETQEQEQFLRDCHCLQAQGYLFSRPLSADDFADKFL